MTGYRPSPTPPFDGTEACHEAGTEIFFDQDAAARAQARTLCTSCPLLEACWIWAVAFEEFGYWANTTPTQRRRLRQQLSVELVRPEASAKSLAAC